MQTMQTSKKQPSKSVSLQENAFARKAIESIQQIEREAHGKKLAHLETLESAKAAIYQRMAELDHQLNQIDSAIASIKGSPAPKERRPRRNWDEDRERVIQWMIGRKGQRFAAGDLIREFPELDGTLMSAFLKPLVKQGKLQTDVCEGIRRTKYFVTG